MKFLCTIALILTFPMISIAAPSCPANGPYKNCSLSCNDSNIKCGPTLCGGTVGGKKYVGANNGGSCDFGSKAGQPTGKAAAKKMKTKSN